MKITLNKNEIPKITGLFLKPEQIIKILANAKNCSPNYLYPFLYTLANTGAQRIELIKLKRSDLDLDKRLMQIIDGREHHRSIKLSPELLEVITDHLNTHSCENVFIAPCGRKISEHQVQVALDRFKKKHPIGLEWNFNTFRRSYGVNYLDAGGDIHLLQDILGINILDTIISWVKQERYLRKNPSLLKKFTAITDKKCLQPKYKKDQLPKRSYSYLSKQQINQILIDAKKFNPNYIYPFILLIYQTGMRISEASRLTSDDININERSIKVAASKLGKSRKIKVTKKLCKILLEVSARNRGPYIFSTPKTQERGDQYIQFRLIKFRQQYPREKNWNCQTLRESFAHNFLADGGSQTKLDYILGKKNIDGRYAPSFGIRTTY